MNERISVRNISKEFGKGSGRVEVLDGINVQVGRHHFVSLLGPSGCGKSTLFNIISGLFEPTDGEALVDGSPDRLGTCGYMQQKDLLMPWKRITDNVALGLMVKGTSRREARARAEEILERFGLGGFGHCYPSEISGGMRQRAALARTFLAGDDVLLLDEPFGALDSLTRLQMQSWLLDIWQASAASILFITHDVDEAIRLSDRVYVLSERPASVVLTLEIDLPRPRPYETVLSPEFAALKAQAIRYLHPDTQDMSAKEMTSDA
ncbi:MAG: ABC transporter ATP-binding protein [Actinobacteria bacterium]|nr:ABC transporter ATP-binding protein [Actinomycetota bacterium]